MAKTRHNRQSIRLNEYDYTQSGAYFVTICTHKHDCLFGSVTEGEVQLNQFGKIVHNEWLKSSKIRQEIEMDAFVIMPNHLHGIVLIHKNNTAVEQPEAHSRAPLQKQNHQSGGKNAHRRIFRCSR